MSADELEALYNAHAQAVYAFLLNLIRNESDVRDLMQDMFLKLARTPSVMSGVKNPRSFLIRWAHNLAIDMSRRKQTREHHHVELGLQDVRLFEEAENPDLRVFREALSAALGELPQEQRAVLHLKLWEDLTFDAIAEVLGIPLNTAASRYRYGLDKLRDRLRLLYDEIQ